MSWTALSLADPQGATTPNLHSAGPNIQVTIRMRMGDRSNHSVPRTALYESRCNVQTYPSRKQTDLKMPTPLTEARQARITL